MLVNTKSEMWDILFVNDAWSRVTGAPEPYILHPEPFNLDPKPFKEIPLQSCVSCAMLLVNHAPVAASRTGPQKRLCGGVVRWQHVASCLGSACSCPAAGFQREDALGKPVFNLFKIPGTSHVRTPLITLAPHLIVSSCPGNAGTLESPYK